MAVRTVSNFPATQKITIAVWFWVPASAVLSLSDSGRGAGFDMSTTTKPTGGSADAHGQSAIDGVNGFPISRDGRSGLIPLCEFGYRGVGGGQNTSFLYLTKCAGGIISNGIFTPSPPIRNSVMLQLAGIGGEAFGIWSDEGYFAPWVSLCAFGPSNDAAVPGWTSDYWNVLVVSADVSGHDTYTGPTDGSGHLLGFTNVTQGTKIWMNLNTHFDTSKQNSVNHILTPSLSGGSNHSFYSTYAGYDSGNDFILPTSPSFGSIAEGDFSIPVREEWAGDNYNYLDQISFGPFMVWDRYIDPSQASLFWAETRDADNNEDILVPGDGDAIVEELGEPLIWFEEDWSENNGTLGKPEDVGTIEVIYEPPVEIDPSPI